MTRAQQELFLSIPMYLRGKKAKASRFLSPLSITAFTSKEKDCPII